MVESRVRHAGPVERRVRVVHRRRRRACRVIVRVLRAKIRPGKVGAFNAVFRGQVDLLKAQPGLVYVKLARRLHADGGEDVVLFEEWQDASSLYQWVGPNLAEPRLVPGSRELIDELIVAHYEALDRDADDFDTGQQAHRLATTEEVRLKPANNGQESVSPQSEPGTPPPRQAG
jgi:Antibiotic biosynthesis monooxygenase